jgi:hypothetical protein
VVGSEEPGNHSSGKTPKLSFIREKLINN